MNKKLQLVFASMFDENSTFIFSRDSDREEKNYAFTVDVNSKGEKATFIALLEMSDCGSQYGLSAYSIHKAFGKEVKNFFDWKEVL